MNKDSKLVEIYRPASELEAQVIKGLLESYGIPCLLKSNAPPAAYLPLIQGIGEARIMVPEGLAEKALDLIEEKEDV